MYILKKKETRTKKGTKTKLRNHHPHRTGSNGCQEELTTARGFL
jgi:hypothetical protein